ncbi:MAG: lytic transglycosylase domain-containing protein, partial [Rhodospirillales bacterium]|nr:lytic transglycosylase domain-containing protein [Rhodospirillales bacterium]
MAERIQHASGVPSQAFAFPLPDLRPPGGFRIDPALIYGVVRAESNFNAHAVSAAGARGLMQITPTTARAVTGNAHITAARLHDPGFNLEIGQRLVRSLSDQPSVAGDLISMLASYNAGLGSFQSWRGGLRDRGDPLLFVEAIPIRQTRIFVERALAYTWLYAARMGADEPSLDAVVEGRFPSVTGPAPARRLLVDFRR